MKFTPVAIALLFASFASAGTPALKGDLAGIDFLVGHWQGDDGNVAETGGTAKARR